VINLQSLSTVAKKDTLNFILHLAVFETRYLDSMPKLLGFYMSGLATLLVCKAERHGEGQRREIYYTIWDMLWEETKSALQPILAIFVIPWHKL
jgi:hypothetical protein